MKKAIFILIVLALAAGGVYVATGKDRGQRFDRHASRDDPVAVRTTAAKVQPMPVIVEAVGAVEPQHKVEIRAQTSGVLKEVLFKEGDRVKKGQLLFRIDERALKAALDQARANVARDEAQLREAEKQRERLAPLADKEYITRQEYGQAAASAQALAATAEANRAQVEAARVNLSYAAIHAPISGRTGSLSVKEGNLVSAATTTPLVVIVQTQPVNVAFNVPRQHLGEVLGTGDAMRVEIFREGGTPVAEGEVVFVDNAVNSETGTLLMKAEVPNEKETLWPGEFVTARLILRIEPNAVVVPAIAVQPGQQGPFVYVAENGVAKMQPITVARQVERLAVIGEGLQGGEQVITEIPYDLSPGKAVVVQREQQGESNVASESFPRDEQKPTPSPDARARTSNQPPDSLFKKSTPSLDGRGRGGG